MNETQLEPQSPALLTRDDLPTIVERYRNGESLTQIAEDSAVEWRALYNWMFADLGPEWKKLQREVRVNFVADGDRLTLQAADNVQVARARAFANGARMNLERLDPDLYGEKRHDKVDNTLRVIFQDDRKSNALPAPEVVNVRTNNNESGTT